MRLLKQLANDTRARIRKAVVETLEPRQLLTASTPYLAAPFGINQIIPAAEYDKGGAGVAYHATNATDLGNAPTFRPGDAVSVSTGGATGHVVSHNGVGEWLNYTLKIPTAGSYVLGLSLSNAAAGAAVRVTFNGVNLTGEFSVPNTGAFGTYVEIFSSKFALPAGTTVMQVNVDQVASNGSGGNLDCFVLTPTPFPKTVTEKPYGTTAFTTSQVIPMAEYNYGGEGVSFHDTTASNFGTSTFRQPDGVDISAGGTTGNVVSFTAAGEWLDYTISVPSAGQYQLQTSIANPDGGALFHGSVAGINVTGSISTIATAGFTTYATNTSAAFTLAAGTQVLRITFDKTAANSAIGNFDTLKVIPVASQPETPYTSAFGTNVAIPAANYDKGGEGVAYHDTTASNLGNSTYRSPDAVDISTGGTTGHVVGFTAATEYLKYSLNVATAGTYYLEANAANTASGGVFHAMDGTTNLTGPVSIAATSGYFAFALDKSSTFSLAAGKQMLQIVFDKASINGALGNFDYFKLVPTTTAADTPYTTAFTVNQKIPAVNYDKGGSGVAYHTNLKTNPGNSTYRFGDAVGIEAGGTEGNVLAYTAAGDWFDYTVNVTTAGTYALQASIANIAGGGTFHAALGTTNLTGVVAITATTGYQVYATNTSASFHLAAGTQIIRIYLDKAATNGAVGNFDWFKLVPAT